MIASTEIVDKIVRNEYNNKYFPRLFFNSVAVIDISSRPFFVLLLYSFCTILSMYLAGKYLLLSAKEDVFITKNGKVVAKLTNPHQDRVEVAKSLFGILPKDADLNEAKEERLGAK